jgi:hypothetical protein
VTNDEAVAVPAHVHGDDAQARQPYAPPSLTSYGSLPVDTGAGPGTNTPDFSLGYFS